jgi:hypothetical protein
MNWDKVKEKIGGAAPLIATLIGGPAAGGIVSMVASALGVEGKPESIMAELERNPEAMLKLKELQLTHKTRFEELALEDTKAHLADMQNARQREVEIRKSGGSTWPLYMLASIIVVGFFGLLITLITMEGAVTADKERYIFLMLGSLVTSFAGVIQYFFGSSKGSSDKTALLVSKK